MPDPGFPVLSAAWAWTPGLNSLRYTSQGLYPLFSVGMYSFSCSTPSCSSMLITWICKIKSSLGMSCIIHGSCMDGLNRQWSVSIALGIKTQGFLCWRLTAFPAKAKIPAEGCLLSKPKLNQLLYPLPGHFPSTSVPPMVRIFQRTSSSVIPVAFASLACWYPEAGVLHRALYLFAQLFLQFALFSVLCTARIRISVHE